MERQPNQLRFPAASAASAEPVTRGAGDVAVASAVPSTHVAATASALAAVPSVASGPPDNAPSPWAVGPASLEGDHVNKDRRIPLLPPLHMLTPSGSQSATCHSSQSATCHVQRTCHRPLPQASRRAVPVRIKRARKERASGKGTERRRRPSHLSGVDSVWAAVDEGAVAHATAGATHWVRPSLRLPKCSMFKTSGTLQAENTSSWALENTSERVRACS